MKISLRVCAAFVFWGVACHPASSQNFLSPISALEKVTLAINGVTPNRETIANCRYPFFKTAYAVTIEGRESENTKKFIEWITEQGQYLIDKTDYVPVK